MRDDSSFEEAVFAIDWSSINEADRSRITQRYANYVSSSRMAIVSVSGFNTNARSLFTLMVLALALALAQVNNRSIVVSLLLLQMVKTLFSRFVETTAINAMKKTQEKLLEALEKVAKTRD